MSDISGAYASQIDSIARFTKSLGNGNNDTCDFLGKRHRKGECVMRWEIREQVAPARTCHGDSSTTTM